MGKVTKIVKKRLKEISPNFVLSIYSYLRHIQTECHYKGNAVICVICGAEYKKFRPYGIIPRANAKCPECGSLERHRLLFKYFNDKAVFIESRHIKVLHFAPEYIFYMYFKSKEYISYYPCDLHPEAFAYKDIIKADITNIPFKNDSFDFILCNHVLEHIPNDALAMSELFRVMKKGGSGIFQVPIRINTPETYEDFRITSPEAREKAFGQKDHVRWYGADYKDRLKKAGFKVKLDDYINSFTEKEKFRYGLSANEVIFKCSKE